MTIQFSYGILKNNNRQINKKFGVIAMGFIEIFIQVMPYLAVFVILEYMIKIQQKRAKEREEERKKGIIREHYVIKTEKMLTAIFIVAVFLFGGGMVASAVQQDDLLPPIGFGIFL